MAKSKMEIIKEVKASEHLTFRRVNDGPIEIEGEGSLSAEQMKVVIEALDMDVEKSAAVPIHICPYPHTYPVWMGDSSTSGTSVTYTLDATTDGYA
jgi:hypothetical protein